MWTYAMEAVRSHNNIITISNKWPISVHQRKRIVSILSTLFTPIVRSPVLGLRFVDNYSYFGIFGKWKFKFKIHLWMAWNWLALPIYHKLHMKAISNDIKRYCYCFVMSLLLSIFGIRYIALIHIRCLYMVNYGRLGCTI